MAPTWRFERPEATTMLSAMAVLPSRLMAMISSALASSSWDMTMFNSDWSPWAFGFGVSILTGATALTAGFAFGAVLGFATTFGFTAALALTIGFFFGAGFTFLAGLALPLGLTFDVVLP